MRNRQYRFLGVGAIAMAGLISVAQAQQGQPAGQGKQAKQAPKQTKAPAQPAQRPATIGGHPNLNGVWQALNTANWNLEAHSAQALDDFWGLGAVAAIPAGKSVIKGDGKIPYLPKALEQRDKNRSQWPASDPEARCFMLGVPRVTYHTMPFQISQGNGDLLMVYPFDATNRIIHMTGHGEPPVDTWMGKSDGTWEGNVLVVVTTGQNEKSQLDRAGNFHSNQLKVTERFTQLDSTHIRYEATLEDPKTFSRPWTIEMPLYRLIDDNVQVLEHKCVPFADKLLYSDLMHLEPQQKNAPDPKTFRERTQ
jgi:hypothetical protein